jgi:hypothetical protein
VNAATKFSWTGWSALSPAPRIDPVFKRKVPASIHELHVEEAGGPFEFVKRACGKLYIELEWGYVISSNGHLIEEPTAPNFEYTIPRWRLGMPSPVGFVQARRGRARTVRHRSVISLRHPWEWNYYHFYLDVLGKMRIFDELGIDQSTPLVVGRYAMELPFAQQVLQTGGLKDRTWIVQADTYVLADEVYYCRTKQSHKFKADYFLDLMGVPACRDEFNERVFLTRGSSVVRHILNMDELEVLLRRHDFRIVDVADWTIEQQIDLFSKTRYLIGIHGAGFTNIIFRRDAPLSLLELHAEGYRSRDFEDLCGQCGYGWDHLGGQPDDASLGQHASFSIDPANLDQKIQQMLRARPPGLP